MFLTRTQIYVLLMVGALLAVAGWFGYQSLRGGPAGPQFGGEFSLETTTGETFTQADLVGSPTMMFFGYTYCPDVCPTTLAETVAWREALGLSPDQLKIVFVTVDPKRDTQELLSVYLASFGEIIGLTGDQAGIDKIKAGYGVFSETVGDASGEDYLVNHTASVFLLDATGDFAGTISYGEVRETALAKLRRLAGG